MLTLYLLRHAKAAPLGIGGDFVRPLVDKGRADAARLGAFLAARDLRPAKALISAATRTRQTFEIVDAGLGGSVSALLEDGLFTETATKLSNRLRDMPPSLPSLMIVGHNPSIQEAAVGLARDGDVVELQRIRGMFPPCGLAILSFDTEDWADARISGGRLDLFVVPDDLVSAD